MRRKYLSKNGGGENNKCRARTVHNDPCKRLSSFSSRLHGSQRNLQLSWRWTGFDLDSQHVFLFRRLWKQCRQDEFRRTSQHTRMMGVCSLRLIHDRPCTQNLFRRLPVHRLKDEWGLNLLSNVSMQKTVSQNLNTHSLVLEIHTYKSDPAQNKVSNTIVSIVIDTSPL